MKVIHEETFDLPPDRPAGQEVEVTYSYDENQTMHAIFKDVSSGKELNCSISKASGESDSQKLINSYGLIMELILTIIGLLHLGSLLT